MKNIVRLFIFTLVWPCLHSRAQPPSAPPQLVLEILFWNDQPQAPLRFNSGKITKTFRMVPADTSQVFVYEGESPLVLYRKTVKQPDGSEKPIPLAVVPFDPGLKRAILVLFKDGAGYKALVIPATKDVFPDSSILMLSFAQQEVMARVGDKKIALQTGARELIPLAPAQTSGPPIQVQMARHKGDRWRLIYSNTMAVAAGQRTLALIYSPQGPGGPVTFMSAIFPADSTRVGPKGGLAESASIDPNEAVQSYGP